MSNISPLPNDSADNEERLRKTIGNMEAAEEAMEFADGKERAAIEKKNARRKDAIQGLKMKLSKKINQE